ncbi:Flp pilus assembly protein CpaB [Mesorhizobium sp. L-8-10]|uniref:Flp pilus assembly protein CpaB n=1 Tax=Mesorhizobium sp. L-8-10 TaxID=2744523 RepID=UPI0019275FBC|nr:Flp pilus assembly protein CpaB [Mesorhizobium sp. L-8-10]BCH33029.1 Flp pilus assembly protein CpaB [Mesorhizobium sp. L-8-10]
MRANTIIMVLLAAVFGVVAVVLANMWLANQRSAIASPSEVPRETIVVAAVPLKFGDVLTSDKLREIAWPSGAVPAGAFKTSSELLSVEGGNRQALQAIGANEPVLATKITGPGQRATLSAVLADGMKAVSIRVNDVLGVAGFVFPGDRVDVLLTRNVRQAEGGERAYVDVLLQSIKVLAVDQIADESKENPTVVKAVTLEVSTRDAQKLTLAAGAGQLSLALRQVASNEGESTDRITLADLTGETPEDVAARQAALEAERKRAEEQFNGIRQVVENLGERIDERVGNVEDQLNKLKQPAPEPEAHEVVREVVRYIQPEPPVRASVGVYRGMDRQVYDVPRAR